MYFVQSRLLHTFCSSCRVRENIFTRSFTAIYQSDTYICSIKKYKLWLTRATEMMMGYHKYHAYYIL